MAKLSIRDGGWSFDLDLLDRARELKVFDDMDRFENGLLPKLERIKFVDEVYTSHVFWARIILETSDPFTALRRVEQVVSKIENLLLQYKGKA